MCEGVQSAITTVLPSNSFVFLLPIEGDSVNVLSLLSSAWSTARILGELNSSRVCFGSSENFSCENMPSSKLLLAGSSRLGGCSCSGFSLLSPQQISILTMMLI